MAASGSISNKSHDALRYKGFGTTAFLVQPWCKPVDFIVS
jgi:hypothetical protein